jgi:hypothetical protein
MSATMGSTTLISAEMAHSSNRNSSTDSVGQQDMIAINSSRLNSARTRVSGGNTSSFNAFSREFTVTRNPRQERFVDVSRGTFGDIFTTTRRMTIENYLHYRRNWGNLPGDAEHRPENNPARDRTYEMEVNVHIVLNLELDILSPAEQNVLAWNDPVVVNPRIIDMENWMYTRSENNRELQMIWDYNIGVTNAILNAFGLPGEPIRSGYLVPSLTFLVDWLPGERWSEPQNRHLVEAQLERIKHDFLVEIGSYISPEWYDQFVGVPVVANIAPMNFTTAQRNADTLVGVLNFDAGEGVDNRIGVRTPDLGIQNAYIYPSLPVWASLFFDHRPMTGQNPTHFFHLRHSRPQLRAMEISLFDGPNRLFGYRTEGTPDASDIGGAATSSDTDGVLSVMFALDEHNALFQNLGYMSYTWVEGNQSLIHTGLMGLNNSIVGQTFEMGGRNWTVVNDDGRELSIVGHDLLIGRISATGIHTDSGLDLMEAIRVFVLDTLGPACMAGVPQDLIFDFTPFDTRNLSTFSTSGFLLAEIDGANIVVNRIDRTVLGTPFRTSVNVAVGEEVYFQPFVRLNRSVFSANLLDGRIVWARSILGANPRFYNPQNNIHLLQTDMLPHDSVNLVPLEDMGVVTFTLGELTARRGNDGDVTVLVPFSPSMLDPNNRFVMEGLRDALEQTSVPIVVGDSVFSSSSFLNTEGVAGFDPDFPHYDNTLVVINGELFVVTGDNITPFSMTSIVNNVAITSQLDEGLSFQVMRNAVGTVIHAALNGRQDREPRLTWGQRNYAVLGLAIPVGNISDFGVFRPMEVGHFHEISRGLLNSFSIIRTQSRIGMMVWVAIILGMAMGVFMLLARVFWRADFARSWLESISRASGIDVLAIMSLTVVRVTDDEPQSWLKVILIASTVAIAPAFIVFLTQAMGVPLL